MKNKIIDILLGRGWIYNHKEDILIKRCCSRYRLLLTDSMLLYQINRKRKWETIVVDKYENITIDNSNNIYIKKIII